VQLINALAALAPSLSEQPRNTLDWIRYFLTTVEAATKGTITFSVTTELRHRSSDRRNSAPSGGP
jgi:hypothetical protein